MSTRPEGPPGSFAAWSQAGSDLGDDAAPMAERYRRGGELGRGGMGVVEAAVDTWLDRDVALKRPRADRPEEHLARLTREARITARLVHPAIPPIYDVGEDEQGPYYTMPVLVGATLGERIGSASLRALVAAVATASRAAGYAHARGVVHRDLKPANVLLGDHGEVWVLDWGIALDPAHPDAAKVGTPGYQAPEGGVLTPAADVYGLGRTLQAVLEALPEAHPELLAVVARATRADPRERYANGDALAEELERWLDGRLVQAHAYPAREVLWHLAARWRAPLAVAAVAAVVVAVLAVGALRAQQVERARADNSLSTSLAQQAAALRLRDARPEAEVLAAHSLALAENPLARGVWMAWSASPAVALREERPLPCEHPFVEPDGHVICAGADLQVFDPDGVLRWSAPLEASADGSWLGEVVEARRYADGTVLLRRTSNQLEAWHDGERLPPLPRHNSHLGVASGSIPAVYAQGRVGRVDPETGAIAWGAPSCDQIQTALVREDLVVVGCRERHVFVGVLDALGPPIEVPGSPSALAWLDGPVVGTFEGQLLVREGDDWVASDSLVGAARRLVPISDGRVAVVGERGKVQLWSPRDRAWLGALPSGGSAAAVLSGDLVVFGASVRRYEVPGDLRPVALDRSEQGGIAAFDISPSGTRGVAGSSTGEVVSWELASGAAHQEVPPGGATTKAVRFLDEGAFVYARPDQGMLRSALGAASQEVWSTWPARVARTYEGGLALLPWSAGVVLVGEEEHMAALPARPLAVAWAGSLWAADERGGIHELVADEFAPRFELSNPSGQLGASGDLLIVADGVAVEARRHDGAVVWRWTGTSMVTAIDANASWIAVGDLEGRILVLRPDGTLVAGITGHARRVSEVILRGEVLYSASWDGKVRTWGLGALETDPEALVAQATRTWGLTLDQALAGADPMGPAE